MSKHELNHSRGYYDYQALDSRVLAVAKINSDDINDFAVYIGACPGENHDRECAEVTRSGSKCSKAMAKLIFPHLFGFDNSPTWRR